MNVAWEDRIQLTSDGERALITARPQLRLLDRDDAPEDRLSSAAHIIVDQQLSSNRARVTTATQKRETPPPLETRPKPKPGELVMLLDFAGVPMFQTKCIDVTRDGRFVKLDTGERKKGAAVLKWITIKRIEGSF